ncbi:MAG: hypothetical protein ABJF23_26035 [Bryobacteraceae bacterium]
MPVNSAVRLDMDDMVLLGEVCHSRETAPSEFICGVRLEQALTAITDLSKLVSGIMGEQRREVDSVTEAKQPEGLLSRP